MNPEVITHRSGEPAMVLSVGFGTAVAMWWLGYLTHLPGVIGALHPGVVFAVLVTALVAGGFLCGRRAERGVRVGALSGLVTAIVNLLVFGSLVTETAAGEPGRMIPGASLWVFGFLATGTAIGAAGALFGVRGRPTPTIPRDWRGGMGVVAAAATLLVVVTGGVVTTTETGMAVPDWPTSFESNMFLLPLSKMVGGVYYEHAHRLFGSLVGLTTLVWALFLCLSDRRARHLLEVIGLLGATSGLAFLLWERWFFAATIAAAVLWVLLLPLRRQGSRVSAVAVLIVLFVGNQAILGGIRVRDDSITLAALHGVTGQLLFAALVATAAFDTVRWAAVTERFRRTVSTGDLKVARVVACLLVAQLALGALLRHVGQQWLILHIVGGVAVFFFAAAVSARMVAFYGAVRPLKQCALLFLGLVIAQFVLAFAALGAVGAGGAPDSAAGVLIPTAHQALGALVLAVGTIVVVWIHRLWGPEAVAGEVAEGSPEPQRAPASALGGEGLPEATIGPAQGP